MFLGTPDKVFIVDKVEGNPTKIKGHPAWASGESRLEASIILCANLKLTAPMCFFIK